MRMHASGMTLFFLARQQQAGAILRKRRMPIGVPHRLTQVLNVAMKTQRNAISGAQIHSRLAQNELRIATMAWIVF